MWRSRLERLGFVHENYFYGDASANMGKLIYEISFFFLHESLLSGVFPVGASSSGKQFKAFCYRWTSMTPTHMMRQYPFAQNGYI